MNLRAIIAALFVWRLAMLCLVAQGADEQYVEIYNLIQKADALRESGQTPEALARYKEAQQALTRFQASQPRWNNTVVSYRLGYIAMHISNLQRQAEPAPEAPAPIANTAEAMTNQLRQLQAEIDQLRASNAELDAKLKEAWAARPAPAELKALAQAETQINALQRERDLLAVALDQRQQTLRPNEEVAMREQQILAEAEQKLARQLEINRGLQTENTGLKQQLASRATNDNTSGLTVQLRQAEMTIASLRATNSVLMAQQFLMDDRFQALTKELASAKVEMDPKLQKQLADAQARLSVYEAKMIPYTSEELALFKSSPLNADLVNRPAATRRVQELPAGAGPLLTKAEQALARGDYPGAEKVYRQILRQDERNLYTMSLLASAQMEQRDWEGSGKTLQQAMEVEPNDPATLYLLGRLKYQQQQYDEALNVLSRSAQLLPDEARTQYFLGLTLAQKGQRAAAETAFRKAVQLKPGWGAAHHALAVIYATQDPPFTELALWHYQKATGNGQPRDRDLEQILERQKAGSK